jgi:aminoglycoside 3-N-acetyltransferase
MTEEQAIEITTGSPLTVKSLKAAFRRSGISEGMVLLVHSSLSSMGWVCGGPVAVILALEETLGDTGTLVMPSHSGSLSEPSKWQHPPVPESWWPVIRSEMPAFDPGLTPTRKMGAVAETFRTQGGVLRSLHPSVSFSARGKYAAEITCGHSLDCSLGEHSPLARIYDLDGYVLLLGVGYMNNTSLHLAEYRAEFKGKSIIEDGAPVFVDGKRVWQGYKDIDAKDDDFELIGAAFEEDCSESVHKFMIGKAKARLMRQRSLVDYASEWMTKNRI